jgi:hypothetical protein
VADESDSESLPLKFHLIKEAIDFHHGLKWERARVVQVSFPRDYLEGILATTDGDDVGLSLMTNCPVYIDLTEMPNLPVLKNEEELKKSQAEALEAKKTGRIN